MPHSLGFLALLAEGCRLLNVDERDILGPNGRGHGRHVATDIAGPDNDDLLARGHFALFHLLKESQGWNDAFVSRHGDHARLLRANGKHDIVIISL